MMMMMMMMMIKARRRRTAVMLRTRLAVCVCSQFTAPPGAFDLTPRPASPQLVMDRCRNYWFDVRPV